MLLDAALILAGIAALAYSGARLIDFAAAIAERAHLTPTVIGLTVVAAGTSAPELFVSVTAAVQGSPAIALGNVIGSNIANIGLVLGACALAAAIPLDRAVLKLEYPFMVFASWIALLLCRDLQLDRLESGFFAASAVAFVAFTVRIARRDLAGSEAQEIGELVPKQADRLQRRPFGLLAAGLAVSVGGLALGARLLVSGATGVALLVGISERVVGLTVVAVGTSLPELVASFAAAMKQQHQMAVANIVGSNIFNLLLILGTTGLVRPIPVEARVVGVDLWVMLVFAVLLYPLVVRDATITRRDGLVLLVAYSAYVAFIGSQG